MRAANLLTSGFCYCRMPAMRAYLNVFFDLMLLRSGPQDIPRSRFLFWLTFSLMFMIALVQGAFIFEPVRNLAFNLFDTMLLLLFVHFLLKFYGVLARFWQTMCALFGVSIIFRLLELPAYAFIVAYPQNWTNPIFILCVLLVLGLKIGHIFIMAHIFSHATGDTMLTGVVAAMGYVVVNFTLITLVFA
jgi:hypothetical protein